MNAQRDFGKYLRGERELRQVPLAEMVEATKVPQRTLELLEAGDWGDLPAEVFVRGFVRSYARYLGLPDGEATARYAQVVADVERHEASRVLEEVGDAASEVSSRPHFGLALFVIILLIIVTITFSLFWGSGANANTQADGSPSSKVPPVLLG